MRDDNQTFDIAAAMALYKVAEYDRAAEYNERSLEHLQDFNAEARDALRTIIAARDLAPDAPIPTALLAAIEAARRVL